MMKKQLCLLAGILACFGLLLNKGNNYKPAEAADEENILWTEDFSSSNSDFDGLLEVENGVAHPIASANSETVLYRYLTSEEMVPSNNYSLSFDLQLNDTSETTYFFVHFLGATSTGSSIYFSLEQNGTWSCICAVDGGSATTGPGAPTNHRDGSIVQRSVDFVNKYAHVEFTHYETIFEIYINGERYISQSLNNIGNNNWASRNAYSEGTINGVLFHWWQINQYKPRCYTIDNIVWKEIKKPTTNPSYSVDVGVGYSSNKVFGDEVCGNMLGCSSYSVETTFTKKTDVMGDQKCMVELCGLNGLANKESNGDNYAVQFGIKFASGRAYPCITWWDNGQKEKLADPLAINAESYRIKVLVLSQTFQFFVNDQLIFDLSFQNDLFIYKGPLQILATTNCSAYKWTHFAYQKEADVLESVKVESSANAVFVGETVTFTATYEPKDIECNEIKWKVNDVVVLNNNTTTLVYKAETVGILKVVCEIDGVSSSTCYVNVKKAEEKKDEEQKENDDKDGETESETKKKGCSSNVVSISVTLFSVSIIGLIFLLIKKLNNKKKGF